MQANENAAGASQGSNPYTSRANTDSLLLGLTENQRAYVIKHLYPVLREAVTQFAIEAQRSSDFEKFVKLNARSMSIQQPPKEGGESSFGKLSREYSFKIGSKKGLAEQVMQAEQAKAQSSFGAGKSGFSAFSMSLSRAPVVEEKPEEENSVGQSGPLPISRPEELKITTDP